MNRVLFDTSPIRILDYGYTIEHFNDGYDNDCSDMDELRKLLGNRSVSPTPNQIIITETGLTDIPNDFPVTVYDNGIITTIISNKVNKKSAVKHVIDNHPDFNLIIGSGDSPQDVGFLSLCDYCLTPTNSTIFKELL